MPPAHVTPPRWLLLPGLDGSGELFSSFLEHVPGLDAVVVRYPDEPTAELDDYARHAASAIGDAPRCVVIAESFSGPVALRRLVHEGASEAELERHARTRSASILEDGWRKCVAGITSSEEVLRVTREE